MALCPSRKRAPSLRRSLIRSQWKALVFVLPHCVGAPERNVYRAPDLLVKEQVVAVAVDAIVDTNAKLSVTSGPFVHRDQAPEQVLILVRVGLAPPPAQRPVGLLQRLPDLVVALRLGGRVPEVALKKSSIIASVLIPACHARSSFGTRISTQRVEAIGFAEAFPSSRLKAIIRSGARPSNSCGLLAPRRPMYTSAHSSP
jgi:hypothetical protein